ncbi:MAG: sensor histidine kinase [Boseongicola sp.]|nr:sensor histidine kinase [Boseongicola sp.]
MKLHSLRARLIVIILVPLLIISLLAGAWQFRATTLRAQNIFDRGLLSAALAISRDVAISDGDALSPATRRLINDTSGGVLFYHVYAPDGVFVTGYSTPPVLPNSNLSEIAEPVFHDATYQGESVRVLQFQDVTTVSGVSGTFNITVWQSAKVRSSFVREVATRSFAVIALLVLSVALVVWYGVSRGLRPLLDLENAIARRSSTDLEPIKRPVPLEARGLVRTLNTLFDQVSRRISSKDEFISNAAHQLRNPVAGVLALAEAVQNAPNEVASRRRSAELIKAAREASALTNQLLSFERARASELTTENASVELRALVEDVAQTFCSQHHNARDVLTVGVPSTDIFVRADPVMLREAVLNILSNAILHGGPDLKNIWMQLSAEEMHAKLIVKDDGVGIPADKRTEAISRFGQIGNGPGSGLGLAIASKVISNLGGSLEVVPSTSGGLIELLIPRDK